MLALALAPAGMAFAAIHAGPRPPRARPLPARVPPRSARAAPACLRLAPRPGFSNADGSRPVRLRVLSPERDEDARAGGSGGERASPPAAPREYTSRNPKAAKSARSASIEADLERARAAARAADDAASVAEQEHEAFLMANKLLLDARAAQAETSRAAALRAAEVAARARASAEDAARLAAAKHELALAEAQSESCTYAVESAALQSGKADEEAFDDSGERALTSSTSGFSEPECLTNMKKAELRRQATERVANAARKEHAEAAAALVRGRAEAARAKTRAADERLAAAKEASAVAAARLFRNQGAPKLWDSFDELDAVEEENERRRRDDYTEETTRFSSTTDANNIVPERVRPRGLRETVAQDEADAAETMRRAATRADRQFVELAPRLAAAPKKTERVEDDRDATGARAETGGGGATGGGGTRRDDGGGGGGDRFAAEEKTSSLYRDSATDTVAPMPEWMYPRALDCVPAFFGKLNPVTGALVYYTGAVLRESAGAPLVAAQWTFLVLFPLLAAQCFARYKAHERNARRSLSQREAEEAEWVSRRAEAKLSAWPGVEDDEDAVRGVSFEKPFPFARASRSAWLDVHLGYALLCPAGAVGGEGASWWLLLAPAVMFCRFVGERFAFFKTPRRVLAVVGGALALAAVTFSASASLTQALASLRAGGAVGVALAPFAFAATFAFYLAPAALLPGAIARAWRGEGEWAKDARDAARLEKQARLEENPAALAAERAKKRTWQILGVLAMGVSLATGSDVPIFLCFFAQLLKADPGALLQVMIDKGDANRAAFDRRVADAAASAVDAVKKKKKKVERRVRVRREGRTRKGARRRGRGVTVSSLFFRSVPTV